MDEQLNSGSDTEKLRQRNRELAILNAIAQAMNRETDLEQALHTALAQVAELLQLRTGWIWLLREDDGEAYLAAAQNLPPGLTNDPARMEGWCYCLDTYKAGDLRGAANVNVVKCTRLNGLVDGNDGLRYHASIPLYAHGKKLGVLNVASRDWRELSDDDLRLLHTVGDLLSIALERARLFAQSAALGAVEERNRLAREIHDTLAQGLTAITLQLETADALLDMGSANERARQAVLQALALTRANLEETRRSVLDLRAAPLEGRSLADALLALADEMKAKQPLEVNFTATGTNQPLPPRIEVGLYRIAQEALTNVAQHAHARHVNLQLTISAAQATLLVEDDGSGFDLAMLTPNRYGLIGLNERARLLGGRLELHTNPGTGTRVEVKVPLGEQR